MTAVSRYWHSWILATRPASTIKKKNPDHQHNLLFDWSYQGRIKVDLIGRIKVDFHDLLPHSPMYDENVPTLYDPSFFNVS